MRTKGTLFDRDLNKTLLFLAAAVASVMLLLSIGRGVQSIKEATALSAAEVMARLDKLEKRGCSTSTQTGLTPPQATYLGNNTIMCFSNTHGRFMFFDSRYAGAAVLSLPHELRLACSAGLCCPGPGTQNCQPAHRPACPPEFLLVGSKSHVCNRNTLLVASTDNRDKGMMPHICGGKSWEPSITKAFHNVAKPGFIALDIGEL